MGNKPHSRVDDRYLYSCDSCEPISVATPASPPVRFFDEAAILSHALSVAQQQDLPHACEYLCCILPCSAVPKALASFLYQAQGRLDEGHVGVVLSAREDHLLSVSQYDAVRKYYLDLVDFSGEAFPAALRRFLTASGFRMPLQAQNIQRLLDAFGRCYSQSNPGTLSEDATNILVFAVVMLNTALHPPRPRTLTSSSSIGSVRYCLTEQEWYHSLRGYNDGRDFPRVLLHDLWLSIQESEIRWHPRGG
jgi:Sec7-like guanine-nucleotide exchange factor